MLIAVVAAATFVASCVGTRALVGLLRRAALLDQPNARSSHVAPTPRGGGIAVVSAVVSAWVVLYAAGILPAAGLVVALGMVALAAVSWLDDLYDLPAWLRLLAHAAAVGTGIGLLPGPVLQGWLPVWLDIAAGAVCLVWFVNLFNFMDGIDGIAGSETAAIGIGVALIAGGAMGWSSGTVGLGLVLAAAALGFLMWNWHPARIFLGDVGSVPLGYVLGFLLLETAARGWWKAALILPLYYLADATLTLLLRLVRGERIWQAHREHFYQRAVQHGLSHDAVVRRVVAADVVLIACAWTAENGWSATGLAAAAATVALLLAELGRIRR